MADLQEPWLPGKCMPSILGWESGEKGFSIVLMISLHCGLVWLYLSFWCVIYCFIPYDLTTKTFSWIQERTRIPGTPYLREETLVSSSLCWRKHRVSLRNKGGESLMVLLCSCSAFRAPYTVNYFSCTSPEADTGLAGSGFVRFFL